MLHAIPAVVALLIASLAVSQTAQPKNPTFTGPFTHENLTIYLIQGPDTLKGDYLTLEEAMRDKKVVVHETGNVNELSIENVSNQPVYIQSGEIVKGGKQDRTLGSDLVLAPHSPKVPIAAFCVEHGRWTQRGHESQSLFASSTDAVAGSKMKLAANASYGAGGGQQAVWDEAAANQSKLSQRLGESVAATTSPSSFQLTLENKNVQAEVDKYIQKLLIAPEKNEQVIGYVVAINGKMSCADIYGSQQLFHKLWPKLLKSAAVEAAAEAKADLKFTEPTPEQLRAEMAAAEAGKKSETAVGDAVKVSSFDAKDAVLFETRVAAPQSAAPADGYLHRNYLRKD